MKGRVLVVDDDAPLRETLARGLRGFELEVEEASSGEAALALLGEESFDAVLADFQLSGMDGLALCQRCQEVQPGLPVIVLTGHGSLETAIAAMRAGAYDFLTKPAELEVVALAAERAIQHRRLTLELRRLRSRVARVLEPDQLIGSSPPMKELYDLVGRIAGSDATVLIQGESGTGKELVARALHRQGPRSAGPFIALNCAAMPESLIESELFGHARGAFTGAREARPGLLVEASGGIFFLDEIGEMPLPMQSKLLRALAQRAVRPIGGRDERGFDARVVAATNRDLEAEVAAGRFREDLYYRLNVIQLVLPPLRARGHDRLLIAQDLLARFAERSGKEVTGLAPEAAARILAYDWPGNVRELRNAIERAVALARYDQVTAEDLPDKVRARGGEDGRALPAEESAELVPLEEVERRYILHVLERSGGNRSLAARILGVDRKTLRRKLSKWQVEPED